ncbi:MurT ligase domain-containing protein [Jatrophihabitans sp. YIM 134969]
MRPTDLLAVWTGKTVLAVLQRAGRKGNALPGLVVEKLFPRFLPRALATLPLGIVVVSGTNGKTTTTKMVATVLNGHHRVLTNDSGSNFVRGVITTVVDAADRRGRIPADVAVLELDEAWAVRFVELVKPDRVLLLNVMRDQLDRFGEIDTTARLLRTVAESATTAVVLNRDDPRIAALATTAGAPVTYYGVASALRRDFPTDEELYDDVSEGEDPDLPADVSDDVPARAELRTLATPDHPAITLRLDGTDHDVVLRAEGTHNAQNAAGAAALALTTGLTGEQVLAGLARVEPAFGRGQAFSIRGRHVVLHLVKNPAGFRQSLRALDHADPAVVTVAINDADADGRDVSWLWDVDFRSLQRFPDASIRTSGVRAADMALRLSYDDVDTDVVEPDLERAVSDAVDAAPTGGEVVVFATYTAMWHLHPRMERMATRPPEVTS